MMSTWNEVKNAESCLVARYYAGVISSDTMGCIISQVFTTLMFAIIIGLVAVRFSMASVFHWFVAPKLVKPGGRSGKFLAWRSVAGGNNDPAMRQAPSTSQIYKDAVNTQPWSTRTDINSLTPSDSTVIDTDIVNTHLYTIMLVTCYSEGEASMRRSLDSLARTTYSHRHKVRNEYRLLHST
jgi:chitin synthase